MNIFSPESAVLLCVFRVARTAMMQHHICFQESSRGALRAATSGKCPIRPALLNPMYGHAPHANTTYRSVPPACHHPEINSGSIRPRWNIGLTRVLLAIIPIMEISPHIVL